MSSILALLSPVTDMHLNSLTIMTDALQLYDLMWELIMKQHACCFTDHHYLWETI